MKKKAIIIKIKGDQQDPGVIHLRKQMVSGLKDNYNVLFLAENVELTDIDYRVVDENPCCDEPLEFMDGAQ